MKVSFLESVDISPQVIEIVKRSFCYQPYPDGETEVLFVRLKYRLDEICLGHFCSLRFIISPATGQDHIDYEYCERRGIKILTLRDAREQTEVIRSTSELTLFLILALLRNIALLSPSNSTYPSKRMQFRGRELSCLTVGIIGLGRVGHHLFQALSMSGCRLKVWDVNPAALYKVHNQYHAESMIDLIKSSDIISLHCDLNKTTIGLISSNNIELFRSKFLVNTSRAEVVNRESVLKALSSKVLAGFATDVYWNEFDNDEGDPDLLSLQKAGANVYMTPHIGGCTIDAMQATEMIMLEYFLRTECYE